jgi:hypothetical protein
LLRTYENLLSDTVFTLTVREPNLVERFYNGIELRMDGDKLWFGLCAFLFHCISLSMASYSERCGMNRPSLVAVTQDS